MARFKKFAPVIITWEDAVTVYEPAHSSEKFTTSIRRTIGFLLSRDKDGVTVCMEDDRSADVGDHDVQTVTRLPMRMVKRITLLKPEPEADKKPKVKKPEPDAV